LRQTNVLEVAKQMRKQIHAFGRSVLALNEFQSILKPFVSKHTSSTVAYEAQEQTIRKIFNLVDNGKGQVDSFELANMLIVFCGGSFTDKIGAAFLLYDPNSSMLNFDQLTKLL
jgi:hypothetical protein